LNIEFTVVASDVSYLTGKRCEGRRGLFEERSIGGVRVLRTYAHPSIHRSFTWRVFSFLSFMVSSFRTSLKAGPVDVVMGTTPPIFQAVSAWLVAAIRRRPFVLEVRDLWPEFAIAMGVLTNPVLIKVSRWLEGFLYARAARVIVNSPAYVDYLAARGVRESRIVLISNGVDVAMFDPIFDPFGDPMPSGGEVRQRFGIGDEFLVVYAGALGTANDIETLLRAAERLRSEPVRFLLVGDGRERPRLEEKAREARLDNVIFAGTVPKSEIPLVLAASDACVATLQNIAMFRTTYPNKVFDYMAAARPTVLAIDGVIREVIERSQGGIYVPPGDDLALSEAVQKLNGDRLSARRMGERAREYVCEHFDRNRQTAQLAELMVETSRPRVIEGFYRRKGKRAFDLLLSLGALLVLWPVMLVIGLLVRTKLGAPVIFRQQRPGLNGRPFKLFKFRTMTDERNSKGDLLSDSERMTSFGRWLRATSLDELPELFNVIRGEMSLVGPRPLLMEYLGRYSTEQARRHEVKPGITGWAQVNGRNAISWEEKFERDVEYVDRVGLGVDLKILGVTVVRALRRDGIHAEGHSTVPVFTGSRSSEL
jgi:lipopolysaccharide/colanic/teichoic acid biosynthesis glycosyltransferase